MISFIVAICRREFVDISKAALPRRGVRVNIVSFAFVKEISVSLTALKKMHL